MAEKVVLRRNLRYITCTNCQCEVLEQEAIEAGIDPSTEEQIYLCQDCAEEEESE